MDLEHLPGLGPKRIEVLRKAKLGDIPSLLRNIPRTWLDHTQILNIRQLQANQNCVLVGTITRAGTVFGRRKRFQAYLKDTSGAEICLQFFSATQYWEKRIKPLTRWVVIGKTQEFRGLQIVHPELQPLEADENFEGGVAPVYPISEEMRASRMEQAFFRKLYAQVFKASWLRLHDSCPEFLLNHLKFKSELENLRRLHLPKTMGEVWAGRRQLKFMELLPLCLRMAQRRRRLRTLGVARPIDDFAVQNIRNQLPYQLTAGQDQALSAILSGLGSSEQFHALLQGDVGSGKTVVAMLAMVALCASGIQTALMVPTDILARQHLEGMRPYFESLGLRVALLVGAFKESERREILYGLETGSIHAVIGTHALFSESVRFANLGFVVIDEQHRFGVQQREALMAKGKCPDMLVMSATPIPRSLAMTLYGDLRPLVMKDKPPGRLPVKTRIVASAKREDMKQFLLKECLEQKNQCYWIVSKVESDADSEAQAVDTIVEELQQFSKDWSVDYVHGRMDESERDQTLQRFSQGKLHVLVSTTVVEVGVNVPAANLMVIDQPERFGLAQLHQLRGRVGRSKTQAWCFIMADPENPAIERLEGFSNTLDGFEIAEMDLRFRGAGNLEGSQQSGSWVLRWFDWLEDQPMIEETLRIAESLLDNVPEFSSTQLQELEAWFQERQMAATESNRDGVH